MKLTPISLIPLFLVLAFHESFSIAGFREACRFYSEPQYDFCVTSLQVVPGIETTDMEGLTIIAANLSMANTTESKTKINELWEKETNVSIKNHLQTCLDMYDKILGKTSDAVDDVKAKKYEDARIGIAAAIAAMRTCKDGFTKDKVKSPIDTENNNLSQLIDMFLVFTIDLKYGGKNG